MTEKSESYEVEEELPPLDPFKRGERAALVLGEMGLSGGQNEVLLVSCKVEQFTVEAKVKPADYEQSRGYVSLAPKDLWIHVPVHAPGQLVDDAGNVRLFGAVYAYVARELDLQVFDVASRRLDLRTAIGDREAEAKARRFDVGKIRKEVTATTETETL